MSDTPENHQQLPGFETPITEEFDSADVARRIADSAIIHQDAIAERYEETTRRFDGVLPEGQDAIDDIGDSAVAEVVSIDHIDEDPTEDELAGARGRHPTASWDDGIEELPVRERLRRAREHLHSIPTEEDRRRAWEKEREREFIRRANSTGRRSTRPSPPVPPSRPEANQD